ncbi:co-regulatory protein PtrA N-terminal domain-containing protein [Pseudomonas sp. 2FG]|uniref:co-regulatory protein PtrA N-terminal domain-containing protein n=1 Tax=Pseudomonas sp. 2FG TaxID=2502191 RepID=UPI0010F7447D|nr:co-regulatory protein PtrA N-terminal domain-containing protein [Pseudomonas sp. 2FG]
MQSMKALFVITALTASSLAMAAGGGDRTFARMEQARKVSMEAYQLAQTQKAEAPVAQSKAKATAHANC